MKVDEGDGAGHTPQNPQRPKVKHFFGHII